MHFHQTALHHFEEKIFIDQSSHFSLLLLLSHSCHFTCQCQKVSMLWKMSKMHPVCRKKSGHPDQCECPGAQSLTVCLRLEKETGRPGRPGRSGAGCSKPTCRQKRSHLQMQMQIISAYHLPGQKRSQMQVYTKYLGRYGRQIWTNIHMRGVIHVKRYLPTS